MSADQKFRLLATGLPPGLYEFEQLGIRTPDGNTYWAEPGEDTLTVTGVPVSPEWTNTFIYLGPRSAQYNSLKAYHDCVREQFAKLGMTITEDQLPVRVRRNISVVVHAEVEDATVD